METVSAQFTTSDQLKAIRKDIVQADIKLVRECAGRYVAIDTVTGDKVALACFWQKGHGAAKHWVLFGGEQVADCFVRGVTRSKHSSASDRYKRLFTIIPQWARGS